MLRTLLIAGYRTGRREALAVHAARVTRTLYALRSVSARLAGWWWAGPDGRAHPADDVAGVADALRARAVEWRFGTAPQVSWEPRFSLGEPGATWCECAFTVGVALEGVGAVFAPERVELRLTLPPGDALDSAAGVSAMLTALGVSMELDHGHAGTERFPARRLAILSDGAPVGGWMTWIGPRHPALPAVLPRPLVAYPQPAGTLIAATSERFDDTDPAHLHAARAIEGVLRGAVRASTQTPYEEEETG